MYFSQTYPTIRKAHPGNAFQLTPPTSAITLAQPGTITDACTNGNTFNLSYLSDNLEVHRVEAC